MGMGISISLLHWDGIKLKCRKIVECHCVFFVFNCEETRLILWKKYKVITMYLYSTIFHAGVWIDNKKYGKVSVAPKLIPWDTIATVAVNDCNYSRGWALLSFIYLSKKEALGTERMHSQENKPQSWQWGKLKVHLQLKQIISANTYKFQQKWWETSLTEKWKLGDVSEEGGEWFLFLLIFCKSRRLQM